MEETNVSNHEHLGSDSKKLTGRSFVNGPQDALTTVNSNSLSTGGASVLSASDSAILDNMRTRINELESRLQALILIR